MHMNKKKITDIISNDKERIFELGSENYSLQKDRIQETENAIGTKLPSDYVWFLKKYGSGYIFGNEIFSIYSKLNQKSIGDVAYQTLSDREEKFTQSTDISVHRTDFGETFVIDVSKKNEDGESPVYLITGEKREKYANNFIDFLIKLSQS